MLDLFPIGFTTITSTAMLFAKTSLNMPATSLVVIGIISPLAGIAGSLVWPMFQRRFAWSNLRILVMLVCLASLLPAYGCLGFLSLDNRAVFSVVIRTLIVHQNQLSYGAGGAITWLSDVNGEWDEVVLKARSVLKDRVSESS